MKGVRRTAVVAVAPPVAAVPSTVTAEWDGIDPAAVSRLESAIDFLTARRMFTVDTESFLEGASTSDGGAGSPFIDIIGRPMTPVSVAAVARRTTRRAVLYR